MNYPRHPPPHTNSLFLRLPWRYLTHPTARTPQLLPTARAPCAGWAAGCGPRSAPGCLERPPARSRWPAHWTAARGGPQSGDRQLVDRRTATAGWLGKVQGNATSPLFCIGYCLWFSLGWYIQPPLPCPFGLRLCPCPHVTFLARCSLPGVGAAFLVAR